MKAVTTPWSREVLIVAETSPYQTYEVDMMTVPALLAGIVKRTFSPYWRG